MKSAEICLLKPGSLKVSPEMTSIVMRIGPRSRYQCSNMALRLSGQTPIFGGVLFVSKSLLGIVTQKKLKKITIFYPKASEPC